MLLVFFSSVSPMGKPVNHRWAFLMPFYGRKHGIGVSEGESRILRISSIYLSPVVLRQGGIRL
jgi:hypothetical protein